MGLFDWFKSKDVRTEVHARKRIKVCGVQFVIKRIDVLNYVEGAKVLQQTFDVYKMKGSSQEIESSSVNKMKAHYRDVICSGVVSPLISRKEGEGEIWIDDVFTNWELASGLYDAIVEFSYGKKKLKQLASLAKSS